MATLSLAPLYNLRDNSFWPTLQLHQRIPATLASTRAVSGRPSSVGLGMVKAVCTVLFAGRLAGLAYDPSTGHWTGITLSWSSPGTRHLLGGDATTWWCEHLSYLTGVAALLDSLTLSRAEASAQEFVARWAAFLQVLERELGAPPPYPDALLPRAAQSRACTDGMMAVTDALYFCAQARASAGGQGGTLSAVRETCDPGPLPPQPGAVDHWIYGQGAQVVGGTSATPTLQPHPPIASRTTGAGPLDTGPVATLRRLIRRGGTAPLVGPTGVGKSIAARQAAVAEGATLVLVEGWPGLEDRDLFGVRRIIRD